MTSSTGEDQALHEWPLVVFTTLAIVGAGLLATPLLAWATAGTPAVAAGLLPWGALLFACGLLVSLAHLGRPARAPLAALGFGRSRLSAEIVCASIALFLGVAASALPYTSPLLDLATAVAALGFLVALGLVYRLPGQRTWHGAVVWMPLSSGVGIGAVALAAQWGGAVVAIGAVAALVLAADTGLLILRRLSLGWLDDSFTPRHAGLFAARQPLLAIRFALVDLMPGLCLAAGLPKGAVGLLGLGILIDRLMFYGFAGQHTTEHEVARIERILGSSPS
jgi:DMSO reductase anchor subunit